ARARPIVERRLRTIGHGAFDAALYGLMMHSEPSTHRVEGGMLAICKNHLRPHDPTRGLGPRPRNHLQPRDLFVIHRQSDRLTPHRHDIASSFSQPQTRNPPKNYRFHRRVSLDRSASTHLSLNVSHGS